jgi:hypothetical protein
MLSSRHSPAVSLNAQSDLQERAILCLLEAYNDAVNFRQDIWQFALQLPGLRADGIPDFVLRRLIAQGFAAHAQETTRLQARRRSMEPLAHLQFSEQSCFVLTEAGLAMARTFKCSEEPNPEVRQGFPFPANQAPSVCPSFIRCDNGHRELRLADSVVKRYRKCGENQELVLLAFQEQDWQRCIHDPLPPRAGLNAKRRLRDTIARLNRGQITPVLRFHGDHTGRGVYWEVLAEIAIASPSDRHQHFC